MATVAMGGVAGARARPRMFYVGMAGAIALFAFGAFAPTYWLQLPRGSFTGSALVHIHGAAFSAWTLLLLSQTWLVAQGRLRHHRAWGLAGIALASMMVTLGVAVAIVSLQARLAAGQGDIARQFLIVPLTSVALFAGFIAAAIANINRPDAHKRLMLLASISLLPAALARIIFFTVHGSAPGMRPGTELPLPIASLLAPHLLLELFIVAGVVYDWRTRGRPHPAWLIGAGVMTLAFVLRAPVAASGAWLNFAEAAAHIAG